MLNTFKKLTRILPYKFKYNPGNIGILISDRGRPDSNFRSIISASIINDLYKANPYVLSSRKTNKSSSEDFFKLYNIKKIYSSSFIFIPSNLIIYLKVILEILIFYIRILSKKDKFNWINSQYTFLNIKVGDLIYDQYIRNDLSFIKPKIFSLKFLNIIFDGIYKILIIEKNVEKNNIKFIISNQKAYTSNGNLLLRYGAKNNIITILTGYNFIKFYKNYHEALYYPFYVSNDLLKKTKNYTQKKIEKFYLDRINSKIKGSYVNPKVIKKIYKNYDNDKFFKFINKLKKNYKTVNVYALNCFSDSPHAFGNLIFRDFYDQFISTMKFFKQNENNKNSFWLIKPHPSLKEYNEKNIVEDVLKKFNVKNVKICPPNVNNNILFTNIDNLITATSTIGLEYACIGKKPILSGLAPYYKKNIFYYSKSKKDYFQKLKNIHSFKNKISKKEMSVCKRSLFVLENLVHLNLNKSPILSNVTQRFSGNNKNYINFLFKNFQKTSFKTLYDDEFYKDLKTKIKKKINLNNVKL